MNSSSNFCGNCGHVVPAGSLFCSHCGSHVSPSNTPPAIVGNIQLLKCNQCGGQLTRTDDPSEYVCSFCGNRFISPVGSTNSGMNICCSYNGCRKPVISQCAGYKDNKCHRFYCAEHTKHNLCSKCVTLKEQDDYAAWLAQELQRKSAELRSQSASKGWSVSSIIFFIFGIIGMLTGMVLYSQDIFEWYPSALFAAGVIALLISLIMNGIKRGQYEKAQSSFIEYKLPGFISYFQRWKAVKQEQAWSVAGKVFLWVFLGVFMIFFAVLGSASRKDH